ncbi:hypothetical protein RRG08_015681 [Elysia crispata]|uniref:Uncharacterized protein n=1 Tax=Elysia crispata TaxID=231223 RepID=A0AAE0Y349_9GAST|nr:hypothetical protein RRG08_015681 [Elysia crispata]
MVSPTIGREQIISVFVATASCCISSTCRDRSFQDFVPVLEFFLALSDIIAVQHELSQYQVSRLPVSLLASYILQHLKSFQKQFLTRPVLCSFQHFS